MTKTVKYAIVGGVILLGLLLSASAFAGTGPKLPAMPPKDPIIISDYDGAYEYKYENGRWYTRNKGIVATEWRDMQANLSAQDYALAVSRLTQHLASKGITI